VEQEARRVGRGGREAPSGLGDGAGVKHGRERARRHGRLGRDRGPLAGGRRDHRHARERLGPGALEVPAMRGVRADDIHAPARARHECEQEEGREGAPDA